MFLPYNIETGWRLPLPLCHPLFGSGQSLLAGHTKLRLLEENIFLTNHIEQAGSLQLLHDPFGNASQ